MGSNKIFNDSNGRPKRMKGLYKGFLTERCKFLYKLCTGPVVNNTLLFKSRMGNSAVHQWGLEPQGQWGLGDSYDPQKRTCSQTYRLQNWPHHCQRQGFCFSIITLLALNCFTCLFKNFIYICTLLEQGTWLDKTLTWILTSTILEIIKLLKRKW